MRREVHWPLLVAAALAGCEGPRRTPAESPPLPEQRVVRGEMGEHFRAANDLHAAIIDGRLVAARELAGRILSSDDGRRDPDGRPSEELDDAVDTIFHARDILTASGGMARLGRACGACHRARGVHIESAMMTPPTMESGLSAQMTRHGWAARRLWDGLVIPSELAWNEGASVMASTSIDVARTTNAKPNERVVELAEEMHRLSVSAMSAKDDEIRATIYGSMLVTCARCHSIVKPASVIGRN